MNTPFFRALAAVALLSLASGSHAGDEPDLEQLLATPVYAASKYKQC
jgi:predicted outer membrane protein